MTAVSLLQCAGSDQVCHFIGIETEDVTKNEFIVLAVDRPRAAQNRRRI